MANNRKAQWETGDIDEYVNEFMSKLNPGMDQTLPISQRSLSDESSNKNMNRTNPFVDNGGTVKQTGDDQALLQKNFNDMGGFEPVMARRRRNLRMALWDTELLIPGMRDTQEGWGSPFEGMGQADGIDQPHPQRDWDLFTDKSKTLQLDHRDGDPLTDQISEGLTDLTREVSDGEKI